MYYKILSNKDTLDEITLSKHFFDKSDFLDNEFVTIHAGMKNKPAKVRAARDRDDKIVSISENVLTQLQLPTDILYQFTIEGKAIHIGPIIGLLFAKEKHKLTDSKLNISLEHTSIYPRISGVLGVFSLEGIDFDNLTVQGYYYKPGENGDDGYWRKGCFPLPDIIFRRCTIDRIQEIELKQVTNNKMFNSYYFDKWTFWNIASKSDIIKPYIPDTCLLKSLDDLDFMLKKHKTVYLKQKYGSRANGLVKVTKGKCYSFLTNENPYPVEIESKAGAVNYIKILINKNSYIIQQAVNSLKLESRTMDFRLIMQKDENLSWKCNAIISKIGKINGICSNFTENGYALKFGEALLKATSLSKKEIKEKRLQLIDVCIKVCKELDGIGENFGDVAIDIALDNDLNIWVLEVNKEPTYNVLLSAYSNKKYINVKANPIRYAMGFTKFKIY